MYVRKFFLFNPYHIQDTEHVQVTRFAIHKMIVVVCNGELYHRSILYLHLVYFIF